MTTIKTEIIRRIYLKGEFLKYYRYEFSTEYISVIREFAKREWAFIFFEKPDGMKRHIRFEDFNKLRDYISQPDNVPMHMYYSSAIYNYPHAPTMEGKEWIGAELVFDLDADHIPGSDNMGYDVMLKMVKDQFITLVDEFLLGDFGFDKTDIVLKFSGSRGYHAHVYNSDVMGLDSSMRRDIAEYIEGKNLPQYMKVNIIINPRTKGISYMLYNPHSEKVGGWKARTTRYLLKYLRSIASMPREKARKHLSEVKGLGRVRIEHLLDALYSKQKDGKLTDGMLLSLFSSYLTGKKTLLNLIDHIHNIYRVHLDIPVTGDTHRLIRCPNSLHGKTALCAKVFDISIMDDFDPLNHAIPNIFRKGSVAVTGLKDAEFTMNDTTYEIKVGQKIDLDTFAANFAIARGLAIPIYKQ